MKGEKMKIELIIDDNCFSMDVLLQIQVRLREEFSDCNFSIKKFQEHRERLMELGIHVLPAWVIGNEVLPVAPNDYQQLRNKIRHYIKNAALSNEC